MTGPAQDPADALAPGTQIGDFTIRGLLGEGAMGAVYLAQDTVLGRRVALKVIKRAVMAADGVQRFLAEARMTAAFNHPHIVTLHAVGEHAGRPFLALEHVDGESLRARLRGGPLPVHEALRCARAIAEAVAEAHRRDIVHADLKPENVLIPHDGRVRVVDFGLAKAIGGGAGGGTSGTPAYMAPERLRGAPPTGAIDVWAIGMMLAELITGARPIADEALVQHVYQATPLTFRGVPADGWGELVRTCLATDPAERPSAEQLVRRLTALLDPRAAVATDEGRSPFPGLTAFTRDDAANYFGRAAELDAVAEALRTRPLVPIVGASGIGKSSFVRAAVIPRLAAAEPWHVVELRPGAAPLASLAAALTGAPAPELAARLRERGAALAVELAAVAARERAKVLLFVDQFEEAFTLASGEEARAFAAALAAAALPGEPWRIVLTVRDDFLARVAETPGLRVHLGAVTPLAALGPGELLAAVTGPLENAGYTCDASDLPARIVADVEGAAACLPLLQFACRALWDRRDTEKRQLSARDYDAMGGATGALAAHAQAVLAELAPEQVRIARAVLLGLFHPDGTRRPRRRGELVEGLAGADGIVDQLLARRLLVATRDLDDHEPRIEVAHEALAKAWPQLARWLDETYEERLIVIELEQATQLWQRRGKRDDETWSGAALGEAVRKIEEWNVSVPSATRAFLDASLARAARARRRRRRLLGSAIGALAVVASAAVVVAIDFAHKEAEARLAAADMGEFDLEFEPFDWDPATQTASPPKEHPPLDWKLYVEDPEHPHEPGREYGPDELVRHGGAWDGNVWRERVEAHAGAAVIAISRGKECAQSVLVLKRLPGYQRRSVTGTPIRLRVPSCAASSAGTIEIPAGPFVRNHVFATTDIDELATIPSFRIAKTETTRAAFAAFQDMYPLTGIGTILPPPLEDENRLPIVGVNYDTARSYCRYLGGGLPSVDQWQKAFRGGLFLATGPNPAPRRLEPWLAVHSSRPANLDAPDSKAEPVDTYPDDVSPYGVSDLAGNVSEWSETLSDRRLITPLRTVLGANWSSPASLGMQRVNWQNSHPDAYLEYGLGMRCAFSR